MSDVATARREAPPAPADAFGFERLGDTVETAWQAAGGQDCRLAAVAARALADADVSARFDLPRFLDAFASGDLPGRSQPARQFSDLPVIVYAGSGFDIDVLVWSGASTQIHDHGFCGAFAILGGESYHAEFAFAETARFGPDYAQGALRLRAARRLAVGSVVRIDAAPAFVHSAIHLSRPCATLVIRTRGALPGAAPRNYYLPGIAIAARSDDGRDPALSALAILSAIDPGLAASRMEQMVRTLPPERLFGIMRGFDWSRLDREDVRRIYGLLAAERAFGPLMVEGLVATRKLHDAMALRRREDASIDDVAARLGRAMGLDEARAEHGDGGPPPPSLAAQGR